MQIKLFNYEKYWEIGWFVLVYAGYKPPPEIWQVFVFSMIVEQFFCLATAGCVVSSARGMEAAPRAARVEYSGQPDPTPRRGDLPKFVFFVCVLFGYVLSQSSD